MASVPDEKKVKETIKAYDGYADYYISRHAKWDEVEKYKRYFISRLPAGGSILDAGCGPGRDLNYFISKGYNAIGIDLCSSFIKYVKRNRLPAVRMDMRTLKFPDNYFDGIWCCASFFHIPSEDADMALQEFNRVLKPKGVIFISVKQGRGERFIQKDVYKKGTHMFYRFYTRKSITELLDKNGFEPINVWTETTRSKWVSVIAVKK
ncbi:MAG: class I SAM-dependent methyltransferase [Candidatus Micrarchaeia archaeon]